MPSITIPKRELDKVKNKRGVYSSLARKPFPEITSRGIKVSFNSLAEKLKPEIINIVETSFKQYARAHHAPVEMQELEWKRFKKFLEKNL